MLQKNRKTVRIMLYRAAKIYIEVKSRDSLLVSRLKVVLNHTVVH